MIPPENNFFKYKKAVFELIVNSIPKVSKKNYQSKTALLTIVKKIEIKKIKINHIYN